jgi:glucosamine--fructose-6-phosphate aminotransferase (isomerizing)
MCGIIGYIGNRQIVPVLLKGLKRLEYRGYDSAGICVIQNNELKIVKQKGKIVNLESMSEINLIDGSVGIAHTRWATHGEPNIINAHPHTSLDKSIAIVHNGIIENYQTLKKYLNEKNIKPISETDSEIVVHLISIFYEESNNLLDSVKKTLEIIEGAYGLCIIQKDTNEIIVAKKGSPLILGVGENEMFIASDTSAILEYTRKIIYLEDSQIAIIKKDSYDIQTMEGKKIDAKIHDIKWSLDQIEKDGYKHFMLKEIFEQPSAIENAIRGRIKNGKIKIDTNFNICDIKRIIITACGTSWHAGLIGKYLIENITKIPVEVDYASELRYRNPIIHKSDLAIMISQSGETADTIAALNEVKEKGAKTFGIVNVVGSTISRKVDSGMYLHAGPEIGVASTKAFTTQVVNLLIFALFLKQEKGELIDSSILGNIEKLSSKIKEILDNSNQIKEIANKFKNYSNYLYLGRNISFPVALEGALKLKEISYIHSEGYPAAEMKHGPIALIDENTPSVFILPNDNLYEKTISNIEEVKARNGPLLIITNKKDEKLKNITEDIIHVPSLCAEVDTILNMIPLQLFAYYIADSKGINVDQPRNLAKSVTVE